MENITEQDDRTSPKDGRCNSYRKNDGTYCRAYPLHGGATRCHRHGGKNQQNANFGTKSLKHGRSSKHLPTRLISSYREMLADEQQLSLSNEIALIDTRLSEAVGGLNVESGMALWKALSMMKNAYIRYEQSRHRTKAERVLMEMFEVIEEGTSEFKQWQEILGLIDHRRKTVESERKRIVETQQVLTSREAMAMMAAIHDSLRKRINDPRVLRDIARDLDSLFNNPAAQA
tara:strand:- start:7389 stop:8081 length:693 start_codon:yes stop_codon:yes gene_type:complete